MWDRVGTATQIRLNSPQSKAFTSAKRYQHFDGGWRAGKTWVALLKAIQHALDYPGSRILVVKDTYGGIFDTVWPDFFELCPPEAIAGQTKDQRNVHVTLKNGSIFFFRGVEDLIAARRRLGLTASFLLVDQAEQIDLSTFLFLDSRVSMPDRPLQTVLTSNPEGHDWLYHTFISDKSEFVQDELVDYILFSSYDNEENLGPEFFKGLEHYPDYMKRRYVYGSREEYVGLVWPMFNQDIHVCDWFDIPPSWKRYRGFDFGFSVPTCCLCAALSPNGVLFFYKEYYEVAPSLDDHIDGILEMCQGEEYEISVMDASCFRASHQRGDRWGSIADEFVAAGIHVCPATRDWASSAAYVSRLLAIDPELKHPLVPGRVGSPRVFFFADCEHTINEILNYKAEDVETDAAGNVFGRDGARKNVADHGADTTRYVIAAVYDDLYLPEEPERAEKKYDPEIHWKPPGYERRQREKTYMGA